MLSALPLLYFLVSMVMLNREARFSKYQSQILQTVLIWLAFSFLFVLYTKELRPQSLIVFIPGLAFLFTHFFLLIRRKKFIEMNSWILFVGIIAIAYFSRFGRIDGIDYSGLWVNKQATDIRNSRILVLNASMDPYFRNYLATPFLNWHLCQEIFRNPDYYDHVTQVYRAFKKDPPQIIIDKEDLLKQFFERMPEIKTRYQRQGDRYIRIVNN